MHRVRQSNMSWNVGIHMRDSYERSTIWVSYEPGLKSPARVSSDQQEPSLKLRTANKRLAEQQAETVEPEQPLSSTLCTVDLSRRQAEFSVLDKFLSMYAPSPHTFRPTKISDTSWSEQWKNNIVMMSDDSALVRRTMGALSLTCLGELSRDVQMLRQGTKLYGSVLVMLNETLRQNAAGCNVHVLAAIQMMGLYEQFNGFSTSATRRQSRNWQAHVLGIRKLIEIAGPDAFMSERAFLTYQACQSAQFTAAFAARKGTSLASREWRTIPWTGREKSVRDLFFDIAYKIPTIVEQAEEVDERTPDSVITNLLHQLHEVLSRSETWKRMVGMGAAADTWSVGAHSTPTGLLDPEHYDLSGRQSASMFCAVFVHSSIVMHRLASRLCPQSFATESMSLPDPFPYALWITKVIPLVTEEGGIIGHQSILFPLGAVRWYTKQFPLKDPQSTSIVSASLRDGLKELGWLSFTEQFLQDIPTLRLNSLADVQLR